MYLDIRTLFFLLITAGMTIYIANNLWFELFFMCVAGLLQIAAGKRVFSKRVFLIYLVLFMTQLLLIPALPEMPATLLSIPVVQFRKMFPAAMILILIVRTTKVNKLIATMNKIGAPKSATITIAVTIRYFPVIVEEWRYIKDAMSIRQIKSNRSRPFKRLRQWFECYMVPLVISASKTADDLSAAAITRGIENPHPATCRGYRPMGKRDYAVLGLCVLIFGAAITVKAVIL